MPRLGKAKSGNWMIGPVHIFATYLVVLTPSSLVEFWQSDDNKRTPYFVKRSPIEVSIARVGGSNAKRSYCRMTSLA